MRKRDGKPLGELQTGLWRGLRQPCAHDEYEGEQHHGHDPKGIYVYFGNLARNDRRKPEHGQQHAFVRPETPVQPLGRKKRIAGANIIMS